MAYETKGPECAGAAIWWKMVGNHNHRFHGSAAPFSFEGITTSLAIALLFGCVDTFWKYFRRISEEKPI
jgi:hypothetical protein